MKSSKDLKFIFLATLVVILTCTLFVVLYKSSLLILSAIIGVGVASLLTPLINILQDRWNIPRFAGALTILFAIALTLLTLFFLAGTIVVEQVDSLQSNLPDIIEKWQSRWQEFTDNYPRVSKALSNQQPMGLAKTTVSYVGVILSSLLASLTGLTLAAVIALFTSVNSKKYFSAFLKIAPVNNKDMLKERMVLSAEVLRKWFGAQFIDMICVALLTSVGLWISGVKYWALYGLMTGVLSIIPYVGVMIVLIFSGLVVIALQPEKLFWLVLVFLVTQQIEGNFILPKLMKEHVQVPAAPLIFAMILAGSWFGALGVFVVPPLLAIIVAQYRVA